MEQQQIRLIEEDQKLVDAIAGQDKKLFEAFYKKYYKQLFALAYRYVGQPQSAEEIVHDVFITIWNKAGQLDIQHSMKSYLFRSVVNSALNTIKKEKADAKKHAAYLFVQNETDLYENSDDEEILLNNLEEALKLLPEKCRQVMYLSRFGKLKQQEIADQMNISIKTVKNHLTYGFQKLREHLGKRKQIIILLLMFLNFNTL